MEKASYFISDLHLEEEKPEITQAFLSFIRKIQPQAENLFILGDFFESWIGDDENSPLQQQIKSHLRQLTNNQVNLFIMHGNRDFLIGDQFCQETNATLLDDPCVFTLNNHKMLLMHGDSLCTEDKEYMKFRQNMRNTEWQKLFLARPLKDRQTTAMQLRTISKIKNQGKPETIMDVTQSEVEKVMSSHKVDTLIHGHTHRPNRHSFTLNGKNAYRYVLGDWDKKFVYLRVNAKNKMELITEDI